MGNHTIIVSDIHLADLQVFDVKRPLWKRYKAQEHFVDATFYEFLWTLRKTIEGKIELVLNGDIFDFDSVVTLPQERDLKALREMGKEPFKISWIERLRGLSSEEEKSRFKMQVILDTHPLWVAGIRELILLGHSVVFVIGNHDLELHWESVQADIVKRLDLPKESESLVRFCEWFYISQNDTLIEHGNQYDAYCLSSNPIHPHIRKGNRTVVRIPFGNLAGIYMTNGMGLMNPNTTGTYIRSSAGEYLKFYYQKVMRVQPFLMWTWFWSAMATLIYSLTEGFMPPDRDPLSFEERVRKIAEKANATPSMVTSLKEVHPHPAIFNPVKILRELWLDRAIILGLMVVGSFQFFSFLNVFSNVTIIWFIVPLVLLMPLFVFYARSVQSEVDVLQKASNQLAPLSAKIVGVSRVVQGHTHLELHQNLNGIEILNTGVWSPSFEDVECRRPFGKKCFAWIRPGEGTERSAKLFEWKGMGKFEEIQRT